MPDDGISYEELLSRNQELLGENARLSARVREAEDTLRAIGLGEIDAFVVAGAEGDRVFTLAGAEQPYRVLVETMSEGAAHLSAEGTILFCNTRLSRMLGVPLEHLIGSGFAAYVASEDRERVLASLSACTDEVTSEEIAIRGPGGKVLHALFSCRGGESPASQGRGIVLTDISRLKQTEAELEQEKTMLIELLHRVKNSLAQITALANIEASRSGSSEVREALGALGGRIDSLSNLYAMLQASDHPGKVRLDLYLADVALAIVGALDKEGSRAVLRFDFDETTVETKQASAFGLILNELLTNAYKYAFPGERHGIVQLSLKGGGDSLRLELSDDGVELPPDFDPPSSHGLGLMLVADLARQLGGAFAWSRGEWTRFRIDVPLARGSA